MRKKALCLTLGFLVALLTSCEITVNVSSTNKPTSSSNNPFSSVVASSSESEVVYNNKTDYLDAFDYKLFTKQTNFIMNRSFEESFKNLALSSEYASSYMDMEYSNPDNYTDHVFVTYPAFATNTSTNPSKYVESVNMASSLMQSSWKGTSWGDSLPVDSLTKTFNVTDSEQLYYALQEGYKPIISESDTALSSLYTKMRNVCFTYTQKSYSEYQKASAIFDYLGNNCQYDHEAADAGATPDYDCYYLEGVFNRKLAVCDGLSKAFSALTNMVGVEGKRVSGTHNNGGHAWNYVKLEDKWYTLDPTANNTSFIVRDGSNDCYMELGNHNVFLNTNETLNSDGYVQDSYRKYTAPTRNTYYFKEAKFTFNNQEVCLNATSENDLSTFASILNNNVEGPRFLEFYLSYDYKNKNSLATAFAKQIKDLGYSTNNLGLSIYTNEPVAYVYYYA